MKLNTIKMSAFAFLLAGLGLFSCNNATTEETTAEEISVEESIEIEEYSFDASNSTINWLGKKLAGEHFGTINLNSGAVEVENGVWSSANFEIDMTSITVTDIPADDEDNAYLTGHLRDEDFFAVDSFSTATFTMTAANGNEITGDLTIKNQTHPNTFTISQDKNGAYVGTITIDRTLYGITYKSTSFFDDLGDKFIYDEFTLDFVLNTK